MRPALCTRTSKRSSLERNSCAALGIDFKSARSRFNPTSLPLADGKSEVSVLMARLILSEDRAAI